MMDLDLLFQKSELIPVIIQDAETKDILMLGFTNKEAVELTLQTKTAWFWSRSRQKLWNKGESSGHFLHVKKVGGNDMSDTILQDLYQVVLGRKRDPQEGSYTCYLFDKGLDKILKKVGEECSETIIAAKNGKQEETVGEISDLIYHLMVMMAHQDIPLDAVLAELERRSHKIGNLKQMKVVDHET